MFTPQIENITEWDEKDGFFVEGKVEYYGSPVNGIDVTMRLETITKKVVAVNQVKTDGEGKFMARLNPADPYRGEATVYVATAGNVVNQKVIIG